MDLSLKNKTAVVLASSSGLGQATALAFAREGANVMLFGRSQARLEQARDAVRAATEVVPEYYVGDLTRAADVEGVVDAAAARFGGVFALVNNSGGPPAGPFDTLDDDAWQQAFELTLFSYIRSIRRVLPIMRSGGGGRILNFTSSSIKQALDNLILSNVFRMGVVGLTKTLARELGGENILVNAIGPGKIETERVQQLDAIRAQRAGVTPAEIKAQTVKAIPVGRYGTAAEYARLAVFLCSGVNTYITGQALVVDGGMVQAY